MISSIFPKVVSVSVTFWGCPSRWSTCWDGPGRCRPVQMGWRSPGFLWRWSSWYHRYVIHLSSLYHPWNIKLQSLSSTSWLSSIHLSSIYHLSSMKWDSLFIDQLLVYIWCYQDTASKYQVFAEHAAERRLRKTRGLMGDIQGKASSFNLGYEPH